MSEIQVSPDHYHHGYDDLPRFISYFYCIDIVRSLAPDNILEIGIGNKTVSNYLKHNGSTVTTCDFDPELQPDVVGDICDLPFGDKSFDLIIACEILEHLPFSQLKIALSELARVSSKNVIVSIPYSSINFELALRFPFLAKILHFLGQTKTKKIFHKLIRIPHFYKENVFDGQHHWEMGKKNYSINTIRSQLSTFFIIEKELTPILNPYHYFFVLKKK